MSYTGMVIKIDNRETDLIPLIERRIEANLLESPTPIHEHSLKQSKQSNHSKNGCLVPLHLFDNVDVSNDVSNDILLQGDVTEPRENAKLHKMKIEQLHIGDIVFEDESGKPLIIFERKTLTDLAASIKDGRYSEQSFRLDKEPIHNHNIVYIIEGDIERYNEKRTHISKKTLISCMFSLLYYKGFSVLRTNTICETADTIIYFASKHNKTSVTEKNRKPYYDLTAPVVCSSGESIKESTSMDTEESEKYCGVLKGHKEKNEYITPENINIIMLSCIPGINSKTATQLMSEYKTVQNLLYQLEKDAACLNTFMIKTEQGVTRKINKNCVDNIKKFLCAGK
jgi:ERCC4-type nuclease